jgi:hypothetical protein
MLMIQIPTDVPSPNNNTPIDLNSTFEVLLYIVAPVLLIILYLFLRKKSRTTASTDEANKK